MRTNLIEISSLAEFLKQEGVKKGAKYIGTATGIVSLIWVSARYINRKISTKGKKEEQDNESSNRQTEKKAEHEQRMQENEQRHNQRIEEMKEQTKQEEIVIKLKKEAACEILDKRNQIRKEREEAKNAQDHNDDEEKIESYHEAKSNGTVKDSKERLLGFPWLREGYDTGLVAPTDCGKSTFIMQVAIALAQGRCDVNLSPVWHSIAPMTVIVFSLEQHYSEISEHYGSVIDNLSTLKIYAEANITPTQIIAILKAEQEKAEKSGIFVVIDNYTKLEERFGVKAMKQFCEDLDKLRNESFKTGKIITPFKIYHAKDDCKLTMPFTPSNVRGNKQNVYFTNNFLYLSYCKRGKDKRVLGYMKCKHGDRAQIFILEFAKNSKVEMFHYVGKGCPKDLGEPSPEEGENVTEAKLGRHTNYTIEEALALYQMVQAKECTYKEIEQIYGIKKDALKKRVKRHNTREINKQNSHCSTCSQ